MSLFDPYINPETGEVEDSDNISTLSQTGELPTADNYKRQADALWDYLDPNIQNIYDKRYEMFRQDTAYQRKVQDLIKAGLNPVLAATNGSGAESSVAVKSNQTTNALSNLSPIVAELIMKGKSLEKDLQVKDAEIDRIKAQTGNIDQDTRFKWLTNLYFHRNSFIKNMSGFLSHMNGAMYYK